jgi:two-component system sensor histidine kinase/response regulator
MRRDRFIEPHRIKENCTIDSDIAFSWRRTYNPDSNFGNIEGNPMSKKVLIVDDSLTTRILNRVLVTNQGYQVVSAQNGKEALNLASSENPDLILMDVMMPDMDGVEVCRRLRKEEKTASIPIVLLSFRTGEDSIRIGFDSGCTAYLKKPVQEAELLDTLKSYLERRKD